MEGVGENERRVATLCRKLGDLRSQDNFVLADEEIPEEKLKECRQTLFGKLY